MPLRPYGRGGGGSPTDSFRTSNYIPRFGPDLFGDSYDLASSSVSIPSGTAVEDSENYNRGSSGTRLTTPVGDQGTVSVTFDTPKDLTGKTLYFRVYHHDENAQQAYVKVAAPDFGNWGLYHFTTEIFQVASAGSWSEWAFHVDNLGTQSGTPDYTQVGAINFEIYPESGASTDVTFDEVSFFDQKLDRGAVVFMFDDNHPTIDTVGKQVLDRYGINGTWAWIPEDPGLSISDFGQRVHRLGWHISVHGSAQWPTYSESGLRDHFKNALSVMRDNHISQLPTATYPNGSFTDDVMDVASDYFMAARATTDPWPPVNQYQFPGTQIDTGGVSNATDRIDLAEQRNRGLILINHTFGSGTEQMTESEYETVVSHAVDANVDIITLDRLLTRLI